MKQSTTRIITGLGITLLGAALLIGNLDILNFSELVRTWWPIFVIGAGLIMLINNIRNYLWASLVIIIGVLFQIQELDILSVNPWEAFWPLVIIALGLSVVIRRDGFRGHVTKSVRDDVTAILSSSDQKNVSGDYKGGSVTAILSAVKIDLRKATIKDQATLEVTSFWGGVELIVPKNLVIKNQANAILGGIEDKTEQETSKDSPTLRITGDIIMAGVEIKN